MSKMTQQSKHKGEKATDYEGMTVVNLRKILKKRGFKTTGSKQELIERIKTVSFSVQNYN